MGVSSGPRLQVKFQLEDFQNKSHLKSGLGFTRGTAKSNCCYCLLLKKRKFALISVTPISSPAPPSRVVTRDLLNLRSEKLGFEFLPIGF